MFFYSDSYVLYWFLGLILLPGFLFGLWAQFKVSATYKKYATIKTENEVTASSLTRTLLDGGDLSYITVSKVSGELTDHYDIRSENIALSSGVYDSASISALGIAAHEVGHAFQKRDNYLPMKIRNALIPITNFASRMLVPLMIIGLLLNVFIFTGGILGDIFILSGIAFFGLSILLSFITLPIEYNASHRALKALKLSSGLTASEIRGARKVLSAAAMTYVAALLIAILSFVRFLLAVLLSRK